MRRKYMKVDHYGIYSRIQYGLQGDEVNIIGRSTTMVKVLNLRNKEIFYIDENLLSDVAVQRNPMQSLSSGTQLGKGKKR